MSAYDVHGSAAEVAWLRSEIARVEREGLDRALDALAKMAATVDYGPVPDELRAEAVTVALAELAISHGHAVALEADLIRRGVAA